MLRSFVLAGVLAAAVIIPAAAQESSCSEPLAPTPLDGATATLKQVSDASHDTNQFIHQSNDYQDCLVRELNQLKAAAAKQKKTVDPSVAAETQSKLDANQSLKEKVNGEFQTSLAAFCKKNPKADPSCAKYQ